MAISHTLSQPIFTTDDFIEWGNRGLGRYIFMLKYYSKRRGGKKKSSFSKENTKSFFLKHDVIKAVL